MGLEKRSPSPQPSPPGEGEGRTGPGIFTPFGVELLHEDLGRLLRSELPTVISAVAIARPSVVHSRTAAQTISNTRRRPSSPLILPSWKGERGMGFHSSRE